MSHYPHIELPVSGKDRAVLEEKLQYAGCNYMPCTFNREEVGAILITFARLEELETACLTRDWEHVETMTPQPE